ncbi:MAG TPA: hypothetical protein VLA15_06265, partial [Desulfurivibrionaceae bacterium]|nr:hypothetical protein [Desulfurivibrionaceae bacterium]
LYMSDVPFEQIGFNTSLGDEPIISYVKEFLAIVPMVLTIWPALFTGIHLLSRRKKAAGGADQPEQKQEEEQS